ncbi:MAG: hypothetical protein WDN66_01890 [Candidatus Saccharibacteria bacterium]
MPHPVSGALTVVVAEPELDAEGVTMAVGEFRTVLVLDSPLRLKPLYTPPPVKVKVAVCAGGEPSPTV